MEDKHYDVFIAGILPEKQHQTEQVEAAFLAHYAGRNHHYKKALQQPGEYCFAKGVSLEQAEDFQKTAAHRPAQPLSTGHSARHQFSA